MSCHEKGLSRPEIYKKLTSKEDEDDGEKGEKDQENKHNRRSNVNCNALIYQVLYSREIKSRDIIFEIAKQC